MRITTFALLLCMTGLVGLPDARGQEGVRKDAVSEFLNGLLGAEEEESIFVVPARPTKTSEYVIGVGCHPVSPELAAQLKLESRAGGLVVDRLADDGVAKKAGVEKYDVIVAAGDHALKTIDDLIEAVDQAKVSSLALTLYRGGEKMTVAVVPARRETDDSAESKETHSPEAVNRALIWLRDHGDQEEVDHFRIVRPFGIAAGLPALPNGVRISIEKSNEQPAKVKVERGEQKWETTGDKLDVLPADIRPHVAAMLGGAGAHSAATLEWKIAPGDFTVPVPTPNDAPRGARVERRVIKRVDAAAGNVEKRLEAIEKMLKELQAELRERKGEK
jgi:hypothetical protein